MDERPDGHKEANAAGHVTEPVPQVLEFDPAKYMFEVNDFGLTETQAYDLLQTLWDIMKGFVQLGFDVELCGKLLAEFNSATADDPNHANIEHPNTMELSENVSETEES